MKPTIRVTKQFDFEAAHALWNYDGKCKNLHGHTYKLFVTVSGSPISNKSDNKYGMVMDFGDIKYIVKREIVNVFDHAVIISKDAPYEKLTEVPEMFDRLLRTDYQPTCECMVHDFARRIKPHLPEGVNLHSIRLYETANSFAEWFASDN